MKNYLFYLVLISSSLFPLKSFCSEWEVFAVCDNGAAVLDKHTSIESEYQLVIRDRAIVEYLEQVGANGTNSRGEIIVSLAKQSENSWSRIVERNLEYAIERDYNNLVYQVYEGTISPNGKWMRGRIFADWIFRDCRFF